MKRFLFIVSVIFLLFCKSGFGEEGSLTINWQVLDAKLRPGGETTIFLTLTNPSKTFGIRTIEIFIFPGPYITPSTRYIKIDRLETSTTQQTSFTIKVDFTAISTTSYLTIKSTYYTDSTQRETTVNIPIIIRTIPLLQIKDVKFDPGLIEPGSSVQLSFNLKNNGDGSARDIRIVLGQVEKVFITKLEEVFISEIKPNQKYPISFNLTIEPSIAPGTYLIPISLLYLDETKTENYSSLKHIGLTISGKYNFIAVLESQDILAAGQTGTVTIKIVNAGTQDAQFLTLKILPSEPLSQITSIAYIGNLKSDDYSTEKFTLRVDEKASPGIYPLRLEISYRDMYSKVYTEQYSINIKVYPTEELPREKMSFLPIIAIGFIVLLAIFIYKKFSKRKR